MSTNTLVGLSSESKKEKIRLAQMEATPLLLPDDEECRTPLLTGSLHHHVVVQDDVTPVFAAKKCLGGRLRKNSSCSDLKSSPEKDSSSLENIHDNF